MPTSIVTVSASHIILIMMFPGRAPRTKWITPGVTRLGTPSPDSAQFPPGLTRDVAFLIGYSVPMTMKSNIVLTSISTVSWDSWI